MQTHGNEGHLRSRFMEELTKRAEIGKQSGNASITAGEEGEAEPGRWKASNGMHVIHRPDDSQGILRISIGGGGDTPVPLDYCTIRGGVGKCIALLEAAIVALRESPEQFSHLLCAPNWARRFIPRRRTTARTNGHFLEN